MFAAFPLLSGDVPFVRRVTVSVATRMAMSALLAVCGTATAGQKSRPTAAIAESHRGFFQAHCVQCHCEATQEGGIRLDDLSFAIATVETAERWQKVLGVLNAGEMPPEDAPQPKPEAKLELLADLSRALAAARTSIGDAGRVSLVRRLNRREYRHTLRDLLGVDPDAAGIDTSGLPDDTGTGSFDTIGSGLFMSSDQLEQYLAIARKAIAAAASDWPKPDASTPERKTERRESEVAARKQIEGLLNGYFLTGYRKGKEWQAAGSDPAKAKDFGFPDEHEAKFRILQYERHGPYLEHFLAAPHADSGAWLMYADNNHHDSEAVTIPAAATPGTYLIRLRIGADADAPPARRFLEMGTKGVKESDRDDFEVLETFHVTGTVEKPQVLEIPVRVTASGPRTWYFREKRYHDTSANKFRNLLAKGQNGVGLPLAIWVDWVEWDGPLPPNTTSLVYDQVFRGLPKNGAEAGIVRTILRRFCKLAFRGAVPANDFIDRLVAIYEARRKAGDEPLVAVREPLAVILASPGFLYLADPAAESSDLDADADTHDARRLSSRELATRLSYFLWAAPPDQALLDLAASGELRKPAELTKQVERMIADPRSHDFASGFVHQWLGLDRLDFFRFDHELYPDFDESTREASKREVYETFHTLMADNRDATLLLESDFVVVNGLLAAYYGLDDGGTPVSGDAFRLVKLPPKSPRGGLLGMAAILAMGSNGERTSPVERGAWVLKKLMNDPPPPAPPNVPQLTRLEGKPLTTRERLRMHQEQPQCAQCHRVIDPIGFGLENFDAAGRWRTEEHFYRRDWVVKDQLAGKVVAKSWPIDPAGGFHGGPSFRDSFELRHEIATTYGDAFVRGLIENLFAYALGRPVSFLDGEAIDAMSVAARRERGLKSIIQRLVATEEFQTK